MQTFKFNGEYWYEETRSVLGRVARWLAWFGGWERGGRLSFPMEKGINGWRIKDVTPLSLLGHRLTFYGWGWEIRTSEGWLVYSTSGGSPARLYISRDGTPGGAHVWILNPPREVRESARRAREARAARA